MKITITKKQEIVDDVAGEVNYLIVAEDQNHYSLNTNYPLSKDQLLQLRDELNKVLNKEK